MPYKFSPSSLSLLKDCPRCFWLKFNKDIKRPEGIFPSLPSGMDKILKIHFDSFMRKGELPPELKELKDVKLFDDEDLLKVWRNNFKASLGKIKMVIYSGERLITCLRKETSLLSLTTRQEAIH